MTGADGRNVTTERDELAEGFEATRAHLRRVAHRMLGSEIEADDALQEAWLRVSRADPSGVDNVGGWLTTVVARVCFDILRSRASRREDPALDADEPSAGADPEPELILADAIGPALLVVLDALPPSERVAFVLHDVFDVAFEDIAAVVGRSPDAARQLASRGRRRVRGATSIDANLDRQRQVVAAFLAASRDGDFAALLAVLAPDATLSADELAVRTAAANNWGGAPLPSEVEGARAVAETLRGRARGVRPARVGGLPGAAIAIGGQVRAAWAFTFDGEKVRAIELVMDPDRLAILDVEIGAPAAS
jgi:RNA polymerase sigma-70 factor (ECF subfamily)